MIKLYDKGIYLLNGTEIVKDDQDAAAAVAAKTGSAPSKEKAAEGTMAYRILKDHNTSGNMEQAED